MRVLLEGFMYADAACCILWLCRQRCVDYTLEICTNRLTLYVQTYMLRFMGNCNKHMQEQEAHTAVSVLA